MTRKKIPLPPPDATMDELWEYHVRMEKEMWLLPKFSELLGDAEHFADQVNKLRTARKDEEAGRCARATVIFSLAAMEAASNDALVAICDLFGDSWPAECLREPPWAYFRRLSPAPVTRLLKLGRLEKKVDYLLRRLVSLGPKWMPSIDFDLHLRQLIQMRNRIVHMKSLSQPKKMASILNSKQVSYVAKLGVETAREYVNLLEDGFSEMKLPIQAINYDS